MTVHSKTEDLEAFIAVIDSGSLSAAADLLDVQVAKISRAIQRLEMRLDATLLNRTTRRLELTEEGAILLDHAREGLNTLEKGEEALRLLQRAPSGRLRVDAASPFVLHQLTPLIGEFCSTYPKIHLDITSHDNVIDLLERKTDLAIRIGKLTDSNLHARLLGRSKLHLVASPGYLATHPVRGPISTLAQHRLIGFSDASHLNQWPLTQAQELSFAISANSGETIRRLCLADQGIALLSNFMVAADIASGDLIKVYPRAVQSPNPREQVNAVYYRNSAVSSRIQSFLDFIAPRLTL
ncbi:LysR family transcriptional regulator [Gilvimarinus chinensis]|uniref:LysR family transcriptional regulator n=1 Tax=Gilvimarinus chinensis TaxID=396005 RepID=UPI00037AE74D|nr:LysR family transcriptional regulator [Gilvimarinus chinensis]